MDAAILSKTARPLPSNPRSATTEEQVIDALLFRRLLVSHRRLVRADRRKEQMKGLRDLDTGELFLTDERRLFDACRGRS
jgi:hypothetical protein